jgi:NADPH2:quinone reductase
MSSAPRNVRDVSRLRRVPAPHNDAEAAIPARDVALVVFDGVGGSYAEPALRALGWEGRYVSVGFAAGVPNLPLGPLLFKNADIIGIQFSGDEVRLPGRIPDAMKRLFDWYLAGCLRPTISEVLPLAQAPAALRSMAERRATGRIVLTTSAYRATPSGATT